jgi:hypothetical protein
VHYGVEEITVNVRKMLKTFYWTYLMIWRSLNMALNRSIILKYMYVFVLKQIMDNSIDQNLPLYMLFIDFKQAYDTIKREKVYEAMRQMGIGEKLIRLVRMTLKETEYKVLANGQLSGKFKVKRGLRQGDPLSTVLFSVTLDSAVKASEIRGNGLIYNQLVSTGDGIC